MGKRPSSQFWTAILINLFGKGEKLETDDTTKISIYVCITA